MKKVLAMILILASVLGLCACGQDDYYVEEDEDEEVTQSTEATQPQIEPAPPTVEAPTQEEDSQLMEYAEALDWIINYRNGNTEYINWDVDGVFATYSATYPNTRVIEALFQVVANAAAVDKFANTEYAESYPIPNWNRTEVLGWFGQISNVMLYTQRTDLDALGNAGDPYMYKVWGYDPMGVQISPEGADKHLLEIGLPLIDEDVADCNCVRRDVYDENGVLTAIEYYSIHDSEKKAQIRLTPNFDENGRIVTLDGMRSSGQIFTVTYTYDDAGNLVGIRSEGAIRTHSEYTYDDQGRITSICEDNGWTRTYTYDDVTGRLTGASYRKCYGTYVAEDIAITYEYDNLGRVVKTHCQDLLAGGQTQAIYDLVYGDYYFLKTAA